MKPQDALAGTRAFIQAWRKDVVSPEEIIRRARICEQCKLGKEKSVFGGILGNILKTENVPPLLANYRCVVCKCPLANLIPAKEVHQDSEKERARRIKVNKECWMLKL